MTKRSRGWTSALLAPAVALSMLGVTFGPAQAQNPPAKPHKKSFAQRHPTATSAAAGIAAYKVAKKTGQNRAHAGRRKNIAQRHPLATGVVAAAATHHHIKKSNKTQGK